MKNHLRVFSAFLLLLLAGKVQARIVRIEITSTESPTFEGRLFGNVGAYEKLRGKAYCEVDPKLPQNTRITDLQFASLNSRGMVEYSMDIYILKPIDMSKSNHKLFCDIPNRGGKTFGGLNKSSGGNDPTTAQQAGDAFLMNQGYTIVWCGWDISAREVNNNMTITVPVAKNKDGSAITGPSYEYISADNDKMQKYRLTYPAATLDQSKAKLTVREKLDDMPQLLPDTAWKYLDEQNIALAHSNFKTSAIYEFFYEAKNPLIAGLGLAATRDFISFLRYTKADDSGKANPLAGNIQYTFSFAISQSARYINDLETFGFNQDEQGRPVFDGIENWLGGGSGGNINYRFAQPDRTERNRQNHLYPEGRFPFAYPTLKDPYTGITSGRMAGYSKTSPPAKSFQINSANEYWVKAASLLHSDLQGNDLPDPENVRFYLLSGMQHGSGSGKGLCQQLQNPTRAEPALRALLIALDEWVTKGIQPPESRVPRRRDGTAVMAENKPHSLTGIVPKEKLGWPAIPGVTYTGTVTTRYCFDYGPTFVSKGIISQFPDVRNHDYPAYKNFVSKVDADGNEVAGIRLPEVSAPIGTYTGWALRAAPYAENDGAESAGQFIPFAKNKAERKADPRLAIEERYKSHEGYVKAVTKVVNDLITQRFLLKGDAASYIEAAEKSDVMQ